MRQGAARRESTAAPSRTRATATVPGAAPLQVAGAVGNQVLQRLVDRRVVRTKLAVSRPGDRDELEADRVADRIMGTPSASETPCSACRVGPGGASAGPPPGLKGAGGASAGPPPALVAGAPPCPKCRERGSDRLRRQAESGGAGPAAADRTALGLGAGRPLDSATRAFFEPRFGADLGAVRVHTDERAAEAAGGVRALAFTLGPDIAFGSGQYRPGTEAGRRLLAHELTHVMQQASGTPPHIQRTDWGLLGGTCCNRSPDGDEWALVGGGVWQRLPSGQCTGTTTDCDGMTCGGGFYRVDNLETGTCRTPRRDDATFRPRRWTPDRARPDALSPTQRGSTAGDTPPGYRYDRELLQIEHRTSGSVYEVPGIYGSESEFGASGVTSSLTAPASSRRAGRPVAGGFAEDLSVDVGFGTGVEATASTDVEALIRSAGDRIAPQLRPAVRVVATDRFVFLALRSLLETDGGSLVAWNNDSGYYDGDSLPPRVNVGIAGGELDTRTTLVHELLHYVFDRLDSVLGEARDVGGADHPAIEAIETRFLIVHLIRSGQSPLHDRLDSAFGRFVRGRDFFTAMREAIARNDRAALLAAVNDPEFVRTTVRSGLLPEASGLGFPPRADEYRYTGAQFRDLAFIYAQNAVIVRHAMRTAADVSGRTGTQLRDVFATADWRREMERFLAALVAALRRDRTSGVASRAGRL